jgi:hypothetical protein
MAERHALIDHEDVLHVLWGLGRLSYGWAWQDKYLQEECTKMLRDEEDPLLVYVVILLPEARTQRLPIRSKCLLQRGA